MIQKLIPIVLVLGAVVLFFTYTNPTYTGPVKDAEAQIQSYKSALAAAAKFKSKEQDLDQQRASISDADEKRLESFLPDSVDNVRLILDLTTLAGHSGVSLSNFDVRSSGPAAAAGQTGSLQSTSPVDTLDVSVSATGTYSAFRSFLSAAEHSLRPLDVTQLALHPTATGVYTYNLTFRIYSLH